MSAPVGLWKSGMSTAAVAAAARTVRAASGTSHPSGSIAERHEPGPAPPEGVDGVGVRRVLDDDPVAVAEQGAQDDADAGDGARRHEDLVGARRQPAFGVAVGDDLAQLGHPEGEVAGAGEVAPAAARTARSYASTTPAGARVAAQVRSMTPSAASAGKSEPVPRRRLPDGRVATEPDPRREVR